MALMRGPLSVLFLISLAACGTGGSTLVVSGETMGTTWKLSLPNGSGGEAASRLVQEQLDRIEGLMSPWRPESDLSRFAAAAVGVPVRVDAETLTVLELAEEVWRATSGAFDPTVGALVEAAGFGVAEGPASPSEREAAQGKVGMDLLEVNVGAGTLTKLRAGLSIDLSAVAKGHAVDRAGAALLNAGHVDFLLEVGGEILCRGGNGVDDYWVVGVEAPALLPGRALTAVKIRNQAVATSGDYRNLREIDGALQPHIFNAKTGSPVQSPLASVTVIATDCATADAYATAAMAMGFEGALAWLGPLPQVEAIFLLRSDAPGELLEHWTEGALALKRR